MKAWKTILKGVAGILVSGLLLFALAQNTKESADSVHLEDLLAVIKGIPLWVILFALACQLMQVWLRSIRYLFLLRWKNEDCVPHRGIKLLAVTFARSMFVDMLPSRSGELIYVWLVKRVFGVRLANGFTSLGAAFVFDLIALLILIAVVFGVALFGSNASSAFGLVLVLLFVVGFAVLGFFVIFPGFMNRSSGFREHRFRSGWFGRFHTFLEEMCDCIVGFKNEGKLFSVLSLSVFIRIFKYTGTVTMLYVILEGSFGSVGFGNLESLFLGIVAGEASASLPLPSFMSFGTYEAGASFTLQSLGFSSQAALISIFIVHLVSQLMDYTLGGLAVLCLWLAGWLSPETANEEGAETSRIRRWKLCLICFMALVSLGAGIAWFHFTREKQGVDSEGRGSDIPVSVDVDSPDMEQVRIKESSGDETALASEPLNERTSVTALELPSGFAVWSSNRYGNHEIVKYDFKTSKLERLTETPEKEFYVNIAPDGTKLVYAREASLGRNYRDLTGWNVILHDLKNGSTRVLSENSFHPSWAGDNERVLYTRNGNEIVLHDLRTDHQKVLLKAGEAKIPSGVEFKTPYYNPVSDLVAVTIRGSRRTKMVYSMRTGVSPVEFPEGCQLSWMPGYDQLVFTNHGQVGDNAFYTVRPDASSVQCLLDLPTLYHHLYFPRFSEDGEWLIYGASKGEHKHDKADYDIFLWRVGTSPERIKHLAMDPANDSWPDLHLNLNE